VNLSKMKLKATAIELYKK